MVTFCDKCNRVLYNGKTRCLLCEQGPPPDPRPLWKQIFVDPVLAIMKLTGRIT